MRLPTATLLAAVLILTGCRYSDSSPPVITAELRQRDVQAEKERLASTLRLHGGADAWWDNLRAFRGAVTKRIQPNLHSGTILQLSDSRWVHPVAVYQAFCDPSWPALTHANEPADVHSPVAAITDLHRQLAARGIDLIFMPIPIDMEIYPEEIAAEAPDDWNVSPQRTQLLLALAQADVEVLDLLPIYHQERRSSDAPLYVYRDHHWSPRGCALAADALAARLLRYEIVKEEKEAVPRYRSVSRTVSLSGVANRNGMLDPSRKTFDYQLESIESVNGESFVEDPASPILIIGDSNVHYAPYSEHGANIAGLLARRLNMPIATLSRKGGFKNIVRELARLGEHGTEGRRVIIWTGLGNQLADPQWGTAPLP